MKGARQGRGRPSRWTGEAIPSVLPKDPIVAERVKVAWRMAYEGKTLVEIGAVLGVKRSTASQYLNDPDGSRMAARKLTYAGLCIDCGGPTDGTASGLSHVPKRCRSCAVKNSKECIVCRINNNKELRGKHVWSHEQIFAAIRNCIGADGNATVSRYRALYDASPKGSMPSLPLIIKRFDTWNAACEAAGIQHGSAWRSYKRTSADDCISAVVWVAQELGRLPSIREYDRRARELGLPSIALIRIRLGSWSAVLERLHVPERLAA